MQSELTGAEGGVALPSIIRDAHWPEAIVGAQPRAKAKVKARPRELSVAVWGLVFLIVAVTAVVLYGAAGSTVVGSHPGHIFPGWEAGPLRGILPKPLPSHAIGNVLYSVLTAAAVLAYLLVLSAWRSLRMWQVTAFVVLSGLILTLGPPDRLNDLFNYLGYARLGALHGLNPYTHVIANERGDSVFMMTSWRNLRSPYGPLFTALSYPLAFLPLSVAYWELKIAILAASFGFLYCVYLCAVRMGRDPRWVILFVAANPLYLFYELAGFHNDFLMLLPSMGAITLMLAGRERSSGAALAVAVAIKFTTIVLLPFLLIAAWRRGKWPRVLEGVGLAAVPLLLMDLLMFGLAMPNTADQSQLATSFSIPNLAGLALGLGGATHGVILGSELLAVGVCIAAFWKFRGGNWVQGAGWAQLAVIASLAWLMPWYLVWALPLVALVESQAMRRVVLGLTVFVLITFLPLTGPFLASRGLNPQATAVGRKDRQFQMGLQWARRPPTITPATENGELLLAKAARAHD